MQYWEGLWSDERTYITQSLTTTVQHPAATSSAYNYLVKLQSNSSLCGLIATPRPGSRSCQGRGTPPPARP